MKQSDEHDQTQPQLGRTRFVIGAALFIAGFASPLLIPLVASSGLPTHWKTILSTGLVAGLPEVGMLAAVAVLGKEGFALLKQKLFSLFHKHTEAAAVGPLRYRVGLVMFSVPIVIGLSQPYLAHSFPVFRFTSLAPVITLDMIFIASLLVLGAGFWDKLSDLFQPD
mgnify:CR=1 FL=1